MLYSYARKGKAKEGVKLSFLCSQIHCHAEEGDIMMVILGRRETDEANISNYKGMTD